MYGPVWRVIQYIFTTLQPVTQRRYCEALDTFGSWCTDQTIPFDSLQEEPQDWILADFVLEQREGELPRQSMVELVAALHTLKKNKARDGKGMLAEMLHEGGETLRVALLNLYNTIQC